MNKLPLEKRVQILSMLCEGSSMRSISRVTGVTVPARVLLKDPLFLPGRFRPVSFANGGLAAVAILPVLAAEVLCLGA